jgi:hypothetical protein
MQNQKLSNVTNSMRIARQLYGANIKLTFQESIFSVQPMALKTKKTKSLIVVPFCVQHNQMQPLTFCIEQNLKLSSPWRSKQRQKKYYARAAFVCIWLLLFTVLYLIAFLSLELE